MEFNVIKSDCECSHRFLLPCPENQSVPVQKALLDFKERIRMYEDVYETITDRNMHYIKLIDMCAP